VDRWNKALEDAGVEFRFRLPHRRFCRSIGEYSGHRFDPEGNLVSAETYERMKDTWLVTEADRAYMQSIQVQVIEPGKMANWIAPPRVGIKGRPVDYEYVRL
jgi:benzoyl-CoA 2,3-dioxygenase component B